MFFILLQKVLSFSRKSKFKILDIQISCHQMPKHETRNTFILLDALGSKHKFFNEIWPVYVISQMIFFFFQKFL